MQSTPIKAMVVSDSNAPTTVHAVVIEAENAPLSRQQSLRRKKMMCCSSLLVFFVVMFSVGISELRQFKTSVVPVNGEIWFGNDSASILVTVKPVNRMGLHDLEVKSMSCEFQGESESGVSDGVVAAVAGFDHVLIPSKASRGLRRSPEEVDVRVEINNIVFEELRNLATEYDTVKIKCHGDAVVWTWGIFPMKRPINVSNKIPLAAANRTNSHEGSTGRTENRTDAHEGSTRSVIKPKSRLTLGSLGMSHLELTVTQFMKLNFPDSMEYFKIHVPGVAYRLYQNQYLDMASWAVNSAPFVWDPVNDDSFELNINMTCYKANNRQCWLMSPAMAVLSVLSSDGESSMMIEATQETFATNLIGTHRVNLRLSSDIPSAHGPSELKASGDDTRCFEMALNDKTMSYACGITTDHSMHLYANAKDPNKDAMDLDVYTRWNPHQTFITEATLKVRKFVDVALNVSFSVPDQQAWARLQLELLTGDYNSVDWQAMSNWTQADGLVDIEYFSQGTIDGDSVYQLFGEIGQSSDRFLATATLTDDEDQDLLTLDFDGATSSEYFPATIYEEIENPLHVFAVNLFDLRIDNDRTINMSSILQIGDWNSINWDITEYGDNGEDVLQIALGGAVDTSSGFDLRVHEYLEEATHHQHILGALTFDTDAKVVESSASFHVQDVDLDMSASFSWEPVDSDDMTLMGHVGLSAGDDNIILASSSLRQHGKQLMMSAHLEFDGNNTVIDTDNFVSWSDFSGNAGSLGMGASLVVNNETLISTLGHVDADFSAGTLAMLLNEQVSNLQMTGSFSAEDSDLISANVRLEVDGEEQFSVGGSFQNADSLLVSYMVDAYLTVAGSGVFGAVAALQIDSDAKTFGTYGQVTLLEDTTFGALFNGSYNTNDVFGAEAQFLVAQNTDTLINAQSTLNIEDGYIFNMTLGARLGSSEDGIDIHESLYADVNVDDGLQLAVTSLTDIDSTQIGTFMTVSTITETKIAHSTIHMILSGDDLVKANVTLGYDFEDGVKFAPIDVLATFNEDTAIRVNPSFILDTSSEPNSLTVSVAFGEVDEDTNIVDSSLATTWVVDADTGIDLTSEMNLSFDNETTLKVGLTVNLDIPDNQLILGGEFEVQDFRLAGEARSDVQTDDGFIFNTEFTGWLNSDEYAINNTFAATSESTSMSTGIYTNGEQQITSDIVLSYDFDHGFATDLFVSMLRDQGRKGSVSNLGFGVNTDTQRFDFGGKCHIDGEEVGIWTSHIALLTDNGFVVEMHADSTIKHDEKFNIDLEAGYADSINSLFALATSKKDGEVDMLLDSEVHIRQANGIDTGLLLQIVQEDYSFYVVHSIVVDTKVAKSIYITALEATTDTILYDIDVSTNWVKSWQSAFAEMEGYVRIDGLSEVRMTGSMVQEGPGAAPTPTPLPVVQATTRLVGITKSQFTPAVQTKFREGVALGLNLDVSRVRITAIREVSNKQTATALQVEYTIKVDSQAAAAAAQTTLTTSPTFANALTSQLAEAGVVVTQITSTAAVVTPTPAPTPTSVPATSTASSTPTTTPTPATPTATPATPTPATTTTTPTPATTTTTPTPATTTTTPTPSAGTPTGTPSPTPTTTTIDLRGASSTTQSFVSVCIAFVVLTLTCGLV